MIAIKQSISDIAAKRIETSFNKIVDDIKCAMKEMNLEPDDEHAAEVALIYVAGFYEGRTQKKASDVIAKLNNKSSESAQSPRR